MKVEHKLSPEIVAHVRQAREQIGQLETQYLNAMGQAREVQVELAARRRELNTALLMVVTIDRLPTPIGAYMLNGDGTALLGEIADPQVIPAREGSAGLPAIVPAAAQILPADEDNAASRGQAEAQTRGYINGSGVEHGG